MSSSEKPLATQDREPGARGYRVNLPFVSAEFHAPRMPRVSRPHLSVPHVSMPHVPHLSVPYVSVPHVSVPSRRAIGDTVGAARDRLPSPGRVAFYGGLAAMAALQLIEWPVAVAVGVGMALASRDAGDKPRDEEAAATDRAATDRAATAEETAPAAGGKAATAKSAPATTPSQRTERGTSVPIQRTKRGTAAGRTPKT
jgi:hypothetical protein